MYVIINKLGNHFLISPISFNSVEYCKAKNLASFKYSKPVYFRKAYEMRQVSETDLNYYAYEMETTQIY